VRAFEHDPEKWIPVFRKDHALPKASRATLSAANRLFKALASVTPSPCRRAILPPQALSVQAIIRTYILDKSAIAPRICVLDRPGEAV